MSRERHSQLLTRHYASMESSEQRVCRASSQETHLTNRLRVFYDARMTTPSVERFEIALNTPAGRLTTALDVPTGFVPITAIVPVTRRLGEEAMQLEER